MKKPFISLMLTVSILSGACATGIGDIGVDNGLPTPSGHPALEIMKLYQTLNTGDNVVIPYMVTLMALDLLRQGSQITMVKSYIDWYLDHLNYPDKYGATGSIYDYRVYDDGREESLESADSLDSYAATFIMLVKRYYDLTGDRTFVETNRSTLEDIIYLVPYLMQDDRLTIALPDHSGKYLMDNCESHGGIVAFLALTEAFGWDIRSYYLIKEAQLREAIKTHFYNESNHNYDWVIDGSVKSASHWEDFYPDAFAQLFPILYGLEQDPGRKQLLWDRFHEYHGDKLNDIPIEQQIVYGWTREEMNQ